MEKKAVNLRAASSNHEVPWDINAEPSRVFEKAADFRAKKIICGNLWTKNVGGREMLKANGESVKCLGIGEKS